MSSQCVYLSLLQIKKKKRVCCEYGNNTNKPVEKYINLNWFKKCLSNYNKEEYLITTFGIK